MIGPLLVGAYAAVVVAGEALPGFGPVAAKVLGGAFVVHVAIERVRLPRDVPRLPRALVWWGALAVLVAVSMGWSADPAATKRVALHLGREGLLLSALALHPNRAGVLRGAALGALFGAAVLGLQLFGVVSFAEELRGVRVSVGEGEPGIQARSAAAGLFLGVAVLVPGEGRRERITVERLVLIGAGLAALGVGLAGSRGALGAAVVGLLIAGVLGPTRCVRRTVVAASLFLLLGTAALAARPDARGLTAGVRSGDVEALTSGRDAIWRNVGAMAWDHPLRGVGAGAVPAVYERYREALEARDGPTSKPRRDAHSVYLEAAAGLGLAGPVLLLLGLVSVGTDARRSRTRERAGPALAFAVLSGATLTTWEHPAYWLVLGWATIAAAPVSAPRSEEPPP